MRALAVLIVTGCLLPFTPAHAETDADVSPGKDYYAIEVKEEQDEEETVDHSSGATQSEQPILSAVSCDESGSCLRNPPRICSDPDATHEVIWIQSSDGGWVKYQDACVSAADAIPVVTPGLVLNELRRVGLPALSIETDPSGKTLVNLETVFYTSSALVTRTLTLLGQQVEVEATPATYVWQFGDGQSATTDSPGAPYPALDLTHRYADADVTMRPSVDATYTARFRVNGGAWQDVNGTVTIQGPPVDLRVVEATPVLSGNR